MNSLYPPELKQAEDDAVAYRRVKADQAVAEGAADDRVGLALSGGGIRSATFALGLLQSLAQRKLLRRVDFLSTVSGGGYIGAFLGRLFTRVAPHNVDEFRDGLQDQHALPADAEKPVEVVEAVLSDSFSPPIRWLRENGRYLSPNGAGDTWIGGAVLLRNWFAARFVLWTFLLMAFTWFNLFRCSVAWPAWSDSAGEVGWFAALAAGRFKSPFLDSLWLSPSTALIPVLLLFFVLPLAWAYWLFPITRRDGGVGLYFRANILLILIFLAAPGVLSFEHSEPSFRPLVPTAVVVAVVFGLLLLVSRFKRRAVRFWLEWCMRIVSLLLAVLILLFVVLPAPGRQWLSYWLSPWDERVLAIDSSIGGLATAALLLILVGAVVVIASRSAFREVRPDPSRIFRLLPVAALVLFGALSLYNVRERFWQLRPSDLTCAVAIAVLVRCALPVNLESSSGSVGSWRRRFVRFDFSFHGAVIVSIMALPFVNWFVSDHATVQQLDFNSLCGFLTVSGALAIAWSCFGTSAAYRTALANGGQDVDVDSAGRHALSSWLSSVLAVLVATAVFVVIDSCGQSLYAIYAAAENREAGGGFRSIGSVFLTIGGGVLTIVTASRRIAAQFLGSDKDQRIKPSWEIILLTAALIAAFIEVVAVNAVGHALAWGWIVPRDNPGAAIVPALEGCGPGVLPDVATGMSFPWLFPAAVILSLLAWAQGQCWAFLNLSTFNPLYAARLTRAYLGASNPRRWRGPEEAVTQVVVDDAAGLGEYNPHRAGGPLHLINITINETVSGRSQIEQRDRKGLSLAFGPLGASVHRTHHALWCDADQGRPVSNIAGRHEELMLRLSRATNSLKQLVIELDESKGELRPQAKTLRETVHEAFVSLNPSEEQVARATEVEQKQVAALVESQSTLHDDWRTIQEEYELFQKQTTPAAIRTAAAALHRRCRRFLYVAQDLRLALKPIHPPESEEGENPFRVFEKRYDKSTTQANDSPKCVPCGEIPVALATSISGAAFTTGLGARTSLGLSLLCGLLNIRLGYWWNSGVNPADRAAATKPAFPVRLEHWMSRIFPVQATLLQEFLARFHGPARRHWYLSDGGHYENLGGYELIRRRVPWIIISDAEADPDYSFDGLAKLVRTARIDFGAEIEFLTERELDIVLDASVRPQFGTPDQLRRGIWSDEPVNDPFAVDARKRTTLEVARDRLSLRHAALAWVRYPIPGETELPPPESLIVYVKPTLNGDEPEDVKKYHTDHPDFPQETTADQFFDEAQWEAYRKLGEHIGSLVFSPQIADWLKQASEHSAGPTWLFEKCASDPGHSVGPPPDGAG